MYNFEEVSLTTCIEKCNFSLYTPLEIKISTGRSIRKRFCSFSFAGALSEELARILENSPSEESSGDDRDRFCPPRASTCGRLFSVVGALPNLFVKLKLVNASLRLRL